MVHIIVVSNLSIKAKLKQVVVNMGELSAGEAEQSLTTALEQARASLGHEDTSTNMPYVAAFCCLGTTRKAAGSAEAFRKVDLDIVVSFAKLCLLHAHARHFAMVSSYGANANSWFLYMQTKGEVF